MNRFHDYTLDEAIEIAKRNDPGEKVPSVSRTLLAEIDRLRAREEAFEAAARIRLTAGLLHDPLEGLRTLWAVVYSAGGSVSVTPEAMIKCGTEGATLTRHQWPDLTFTAHWKPREESGTCAGQ